MLGRLRSTLSSADRMVWAHNARFSGPVRFDEWVQQMLLETAKHRDRYADPIVIA
jgi:hypothetical protein